ncbi:MAG: hypothetical protein ACLGG0_15560 [Bacteriovoracia bacterium]
MLLKKVSVKTREDQIDGQDAACRKHDLDLITIANRESIFEDGYNNPVTANFVGSADFGIYYASRMFADSEIALNSLNHNNWNGKPLMYPEKFARSVAFAYIFGGKAVAQTFNPWEAGFNAFSWLSTSRNGNSYIRAITFGAIKI